jgi:hypothetical protein
MTAASLLSLILRCERGETARVSKDEQLGPSPFKARPTFVGLTPQGGGSPK